MISKLFGIIGASGFGSEAMPLLEDSIKKIQVTLRVSYM